MRDKRRATKRAQHAAASLGAAEGVHALDRVGGTERERPASLGTDGGDGAVTPSGGVL